MVRRLSYALAVAVIGGLIPLASTPSGVLAQSGALAQSGVPAQSAVLAQSSEPSQGDACGDLARIGQPGMSVTAAPVVAGAFTPSGGGGSAQSARFAALPAFCRVQATLSPTPDSDIRMELWLPTSNWNGRFQGVGGRALGGVIVYPAMADALAAGYATASTDTGHVGPGGTFVVNHPEKLIDHGHRAVHEMTVAAKRLIAAYYARPAQHAYWNGCSLGGRQGLAEAQRYPDDYDGVIAGDIANDITGLYAARLTQHQFAHRNERSILTDAMLKALNAASVAACDAVDGVRDGVLENPSQCHFDPATVMCGAAGAPADCLNPEQVDSARFVYSPVKRPDTGAVLSNGLMPGSEAGWRAILGPEPERNSVEVYRYMVFKNPQWDWHAFELAAALTAAKSSQLNEIDATSPDVRAFFSRGGKLLMTHGWADPQTPPLNGLDYFTRVRSVVGDTRAASSLRLFMVPGMGHCDGGVGTDTFDAMQPLVNWVERGIAPGRFDARRMVDGRAVRTRPLCAYPTVARWSGKGDTDSAANFTCVAP